MKRRIYIAVDILDGEMSPSLDDLAMALSLLFNEGNEAEPEPYLWGENPVVYETISDLVSEEQAS